jgi:transposase
MRIETEKQRLYFKEVIRLHYEYGYGESRISKILPIGHATVSRWIAIFAAENAEKSIPMKRARTKSKLPTATEPPPNMSESTDIKVLQAEVVRLKSQLKSAQMRADAYDEMINVAESKFHLPIRKKVGAKQ